MERGEVWWARLSLPAGRRPVLLLSRNRAYQVRRSVTIAPITRTVRGIPVEVQIDESDGMPTRCAVNLDDILTVPIAILEDRVTTLGRDTIPQVNAAIAF